uniref:Uncharacterized protein n=1 Tax=Chromera velia CCMP2878 TaxID=1169474 RepID=A0A0G4F3H2_9ALVE|eukprot:Cvel_14797.t1-p1 / transcript=Cvel_14797.t1 / gene=Cvel_14797 / organism=Chromera_velia_CCMP2878 / gene_product=hypothetical protein / transcript_product=hypothetical protein / location=Cvel_scaffold1067:20652-21332(-) / protein_length=227 / sequence_SO=supercontig / SO=protein_coding / is_pseudo=false
MVRRPKKSWRSKVLFLDFKKFVPRTSQRQKEYQVRVTQRGVYRTAEEAEEPWASAPHGRRNRPGGAGAFSWGLVVGARKVWAHGELSANYKGPEVAKWLKQKVAPTLKAAKVGRTYTFRTDRDPCLTGAVGKEALKALPCPHELAEAHMQAAMPHDFSIWHKVQSTIVEEEADWPPSQRTESRASYKARVGRIVRNLDGDYIKKVCASVYNRAQAIVEAKGYRHKAD